MPRLKTIVALVLLVAWVPVTSHCLLEMAGLIHEDECCTESPADPFHPHDASDGNCQIESGGFFLPKPAKFAAAAVTLPLACPLEAGRHLHRPVAFLTVSGCGPPAELSARWQFELRAALLARAPSSPA